MAVSVTTLDASLERVLEPRAASGRARLSTIQSLATAGIPVTVMAAPMIPKINDHELEDILHAAKDAGTRASGYIMLRLPLEVGRCSRPGSLSITRTARIMSWLSFTRVGKVETMRPASTPVCAVVVILLIC